MSYPDDKGIKKANIVHTEDVGIPYVTKVDGEYVPVHGGTTKEVRNVSLPIPYCSRCHVLILSIQVELYAALQASPIPRWSKPSMHLYLAILTAWFSSCANG